MIRQIIMLNKTTLDKLFEKFLNLSIIANPYIVWNCHFHLMNQFVFFYADLDQ